MMIVSMSEDLSNQQVVVLADGDDAVRGELQQALEGAGLIVHATGEAREAADLIDEVRPAALITEVMLPGGSGLELCERAVAMANAPVVLTSATVRSEEQRSELCRKHGAEVLFTKPFPFEDLAAEVSRLVRTGRTRRSEGLRPDALVFHGDLIEGGVLGPFSYPLLLMHILRSRESGVLSLEREFSERTIYFLNGAPVFVASATRGENLGRLLVERGRITEDQYQEANELMLRKGIRQGEALVELGALTFRDLYQALHEQAREKLIQGFTWDAGGFSFVRTESFVDKLTLLELDPYAAIAEGVRRYYPLDRLVPLFDRLAETYPAVNENFVRYFDRLRLPEKERRFAASLRGHESVRELAGQENVELRELLRIVTMLLLVDMLTLHAERRRAVPDDPGIQVAGGEESGGVSEKDAGARELVLENYLRVKSYNFFQVLGVRPGASEAQIRSQYEKLSRKYHPDQFADVDLGPVAARLEEIHLKIELAYRTLSSMQRRSEYEAFLKRSEEMVQSDLSAVLGAEMEFCRGQELLEEGRFEEAIDSLRMAAEQNPFEPQYHTLLGVAIFRSDPDRAMEARSHISRALAIDPRYADALAELGRIYAFEGKVALARRHFEGALRVNPGDERVERDLARLQEESAG